MASTIIYSLLYLLNCFASLQDTSNNISIALSKESTPIGSQACVDFVTTQFDAVVSMQYTITWNPKLLQYKKINQFGLSTITKDNFGDNNIDKGKLTFSWFDPSVRGVSLPNGTNLYQVCFDAIGAQGSKAYIQISSQPTIIEVTDVYGAILNLDWTAGRVLIK